MIDGYPTPTHASQYDPGQSQRTRTSGCTWTSGANGANAANGHNLTPDDVLGHVRNSEETSPLTPGWSLADLDLAMRRIGAPFVIGAGGWNGLQAARATGRYVVLQGDSDQFPIGCSGTFDGDHCIGVHPANDGTRWWINDPICPDGRWEEATILYRYASKFNAGIRFGLFTNPIQKGAIVAADDRITQPAGLGLATSKAVAISAGRFWYVDGECTVRSSAALTARTVPYLGIAAGGGWAVAINSVTIGYLKPGTGTIVDVPAPPVLVPVPVTYDVTVGGKPAGSVTLP
jgi:hypothetical protein